MINAQYKTVKPAVVKEPVYANFVNLADSALEGNNDITNKTYDNSSMISSSEKREDNVQNTSYSMKQCKCVKCGRSFLTSTDSVNTSCIHCDQKEYNTKPNKFKKNINQDNCSYKKNSSFIKKIDDKSSYNGGDNKTINEKSNIIWKILIVIFSLALICLIISLVYIYRNEIVYFFIYYIFRYAALIAAAFCACKIIFSWKRSKAHSYFYLMIIFLIVAKLLSKWTL